MKNPQAFPCHPDTPPEYDGMTLRDYFAAKALPICYQYWMTDYHHPNIVDSKDRNARVKLIAEDAYDLADAMLKAREQ